MRDSFLSCSAGVVAIIVFHLLHLLVVFLQGVQAFFCFELKNSRITIPTIGCYVFLDSAFFWTTISYVYCKSHGSAPLFDSGSLARARNAYFGHGSGDYH